ncbi:unnamed protein product, partial [Porites lobata]
MTLTLSNKWIFQFFSVACSPQRMVETYQYLPFNKNIPIKGFKFYVSTASWKMKRPPAYLLRAYEPFYGARVFVVFASRRRKLLKINFLPDLAGKVMSKKAEYISRYGEQIISVTVMLGCLGYEGYVTFTDLAVKPIYEKIRSRTNITPKSLLAPCQASTKRPQLKSGDFLTEILYSASSATDSDAITLVTQLTFDRITMLKRILRFWNGPLSVVVYVVLDDDDESIDFKTREVLIGLPPHLFTKYSTLSVIVIYGNKIGLQYPINRLRNIAIRNAKTQYIFLVDVDFVPSPYLEIVARDNIIEYNKKRNNTDDKVAFVVPAFDGARNLFTRELPETKEKLVKMVKRKRKLSPFRQIESPLSHSSTNYSKWYNSNESYEVSGYQDKYEPYLILRMTPELPLYDERFTGYGMNKISHIIELTILRYKFIVLPDVWIVHRYHRLSPLSFAHMTDPDIRFKNRLKRFEFINDLYTKYKIGQCNS